MDNIKWGIIGCGDVTEVKSGPGFQKASGSELVAVMRRNGELAKDYAERHHVPKWYDNAEALIADPEVDAVYIATPPAFHKEYAIQCALAGKAAYVEKPMAVTFEDCQIMLREFEKNNVPLFVAYYRRALDYFVKVKELVADGTIGEVRFVSVVQYQKPAVDSQSDLPWRLIPELSGGGLFHDVASHTLDVLDYILGPIAKASGLSANQAKAYAADDIVSANFEFSNGALGIAVWCFNSFKYFDINEITGSKGKITFSTFGAAPITVETEDGVKEYAFTNPAHVQQPLIQAVVNELHQQGKSPSNGVSAARTSWVMEQILKK